MKRFKFLKKDKVSELPKKSGVYAFLEGKNFLYIGKAINIKERIKSHFRNQGFKEKVFLRKSNRIGYIETDSEIEALILEARLIKKHQPQYNVIWKDDKNFFFVGITKEEFPRVFITHQLQKESRIKNHESSIIKKKRILNTKYKILNTEFVGPFVDGKALKETLKILRKIFPYRSCKEIPKKPCFWHHLNMCPGACLLKGNLAFQIPGSKIKRESKENIDNLLRILKGERTELFGRLKKEMEKCSKEQDFERAAKIRDKYLSLERVLTNSRVLISEEMKGWSKIEKALKKILKEKRAIKRVEGYDVSNIQGKQATGSMVVFLEGMPEKSLYRKFKVRINAKPNDIAMLEEVLRRRFGHKEWGLPDLIFIDGGIAQLNIAVKVKNSASAPSVAKAAGDRKTTAGRQKFIPSEVEGPKIKGKIRVISLAKGKKQLYVEGRKSPVALDALPSALKFFILRLDEEAHRFAVRYHRKLRSMEFKTSGQKAGQR